VDLIENIRFVFDNYPFLNTQILVAARRTPNHVAFAAQIGADTNTIPPDVTKKLAFHPLTNSGLNQFNADWAKTGQSIV
jgi:transaldolase